MPLGALAAVSFNSHSSSSSSSSAPAAKLVPPAQLGAVLTLAGLSPDALAAAGVTSLQCEGMFDITNVYCLQADRLDQLRLAHRAVNEARDPVVAQAKSDSLAHLAAIKAVWSSRSSPRP